MEAQRAVMKAMPNGTSNLPSMPVRKKRGMKLTMIINVELRIGKRTSLEASKTMFINGCRLPSGFIRFSRSRLYTFSTSTMASSTSEPIAIAIPPRLMVLMVRPIKWSTNIDITNDRGMVTREINVVRTFIRKINNTITTKKPPS